MRHFIVAFALTLALYIPAAYADETVKIGIGLPLSGAAASTGAEIRKSFETIIHNINDAGGVLGKRIDAQYQDDACDAKQGQIVASRFASEGVVMASHLCSPSCMAAKDVYRENNILLIASGCSNDALTENGSIYINRAYYSASDYAETVATYILNHENLRNIVYVTDREGFMTNLSNQIQDIMTLNHIESAGAITFGTGEKDFRASITKLKQKKVDIIVMAAWPNELGLFVRQAREMGLKTPIIASDTGSVDTVPQIAGKYVDGLLFPFPPEYTADNNEAVADLKTKKAKVSALTLFPYSVIQIWAEAAKQAGTTESGKVADVLRHSKFETAIGDVMFDKKGNLIGPKPVIYRYEGSTYRPLSGE